MNDGTWVRLNEQMQEQSQRVTQARILVKTCEQPHFILLAQDITADLVVEFWALINAKLTELVARGVDPEDAMESIRETWHFPTEMYAGLMKLQKHADAVRIAREMRAYPGERKVAD